jgi:hypothetical protein
MLNDPPKGLLELLKDKRRSDLSGLVPVANDETEDLVAPMDEELTATLRKKRRTSLLRAQLRSGGYADLAKMISLHDEKGR